MSVTTVNLQSSDGNIVVVDQNVIKQMVTIQTMLDNLDVDDTNNISIRRLEIHSCNRHYYLIDIKNENQYFSCIL